MNGIIKNYNTDKGYGFISAENNEDIFFHISRMSNRQLLPETGMLVSFNISDTPKGKNASEIVILTGNNKFLALADLRIKLSNIKTYGIKNTSESYLSDNKSSPPKIEESIKEIERKEASIEASIKGYIKENEASIKEKQLEIQGLQIDIKTFEFSSRLVFDSNNKISKLTEEIKELTEEISQSKSRLMKKDYKYDINAYFNKQVSNHLNIINSKEYKLAQNNQLAYLYITTYQNDNYIFWYHEAEFDIYGKLKEIDDYFGCKSNKVYCTNW